MGKKPKKHRKPKRKQRLIDYFNEQSGVCAYCLEPMTLKLHQSNTATIDHAHPQSEGGAKERFNEVAACSDCNSKKSSILLVDWLRINAARHAQPLLTVIINEGLEHDRT